MCRTEAQHATTENLTNMSNPQIDDSNSPESTYATDSTDTVREKALINPEAIHSARGINIPKFNTKDSKFC